MKTRDITHLFAIGTPYLLMLSTLYLYGFWSTFKINIFEFLEWPQIAMLSIQQLLSLFIAFFFGSLAGFLIGIISPHIFNKTNNSRKSKKKISHIIHNWPNYIKKWENYILMGLLLITIISLLVHIFLPDYVGRLIMAVLLGPIFGILLFRSSLLSDILPQKMRIIALFIIGFMPLYVLSAGSRDAYFKTKSNNITQVHINGQFYSEYAYIGYAGSNYYLYHLTEETLLGIQDGEVKKIKFIQNEGYESPIKKLWDQFFNLKLLQTRFKK